MRGGACRRQCPQVWDSAKARHTRGRMGDGLAGGPCTAPVRVDASENGGEIRAARAWPPIGRQFMRLHACSHPAPRR